MRRGSLYIADGEILKISIDYSDTDAASCEDFEFNDEGYRWKYICEPFGLKFQLLKNQMQGM